MRQRYCLWERRRWRQWTLAMRTTDLAVCEQAAADGPEEDERGVPITRVILPSGMRPADPPKRNRR